MAEPKKMKKGGLPNDEQLKKILLDENYVSDEDIFLAEKKAKKEQGSILDYLYAQEIISQDLLGQAIAESFKVQYSDLNSHLPSSEQMEKIPEDKAKKFRAVLFSEDDTKAVIATDDPEQTGLGAILKNIFPTKELIISYSLSDDIDKVLIRYRKPLDTRFNKIIKSEERVAPEIIEEIIDDALVFRASDIHFEPQDKNIIVRFRVDGVLREAGKIPKTHYENILNRIKVQAKLRIDDHFSAQDGSMRMMRKDKRVDLRISIVPTLIGEKIVIRILAEYIRDFTLADLGLSPSDQKILDQASKKPFGMILVTGPTGSGKTTTLYAILKELNQPEVNVTTIEDPVEYQLAGANQIQVNLLTDLTFAKGLRSIVRQDPDIILVGEIRDEETAEIGVNAALTGHLLFSTFHANDAATAIPRLLDMKTEPFLLSSTLELLVAQRLVRKICEKCRYSSQISYKEADERIAGVSNFFEEKKITLYQGKGCDSCNHTGYHGRTAIFELISVDDEMQNLIMQNPSTNQIWELARAKGSKTLFEDGIEKVRAGVTTLEELSRVAAPPEIKK